MMITIQQLIPLALYIGTGAFLFHGCAYIGYRWEASRKNGSLTTTAATTRTKPATSTTTIKPNLCVLSTVLSLDDVHDTVWDSLEEWCQKSNTDIFVVYKMGQVGNSYEKRLQTSCNTLHLQQQPAALPENRIDRIAMLRNIAKRLPSNPNTYQAVVVLDMDVELLPNWTEMAHSLHHMTSSTNGGREDWDILCCNGYEIFSGMKQIYDLYPLVLMTEDGKDGGRWPFRELGLYWYLTLQQPRLYERVKAYDDSVYEVQSCFGGLAFYRPEIYFDAQCMYDTVPTSLSHYADSDGKVCEHLVLHECLHHFHSTSQKQLHVGIVPNLPLKRTCGGACPLVPYIYLLILIVLTGAWWMFCNQQRRATGPKNNKKRGLYFSKAKRIAGIGACTLCF